MYVCIHTYIYSTCIYIHICMYTYVWICVCMGLLSLSCKWDAHVCMWFLVYHIRRHTHIAYTSMSCTHTDMYFIPVCMYACMCALFIYVLCQVFWFLCLSCMHAYIHIYIRTYIHKNTDTHVHTHRHVLYLFIMSSIMIPVSIMHAHIHTYTHTHSDTHAYTHDTILWCDDAHMHTHTHTHIVWITCW